MLCGYESGFERPPRSFLCDDSASVSTSLNAGGRALWDDREARDGLSFHMVGVIHVHMYLGGGGRARGAF